VFAQGAMQTRQNRKEQSIQEKGSVIISRKDYFIARTLFGSVL